MSLQRLIGVIGGLYKIRIEGFDGKPGNELPLGKPIFKLEVARDLDDGHDVTQIVGERLPPGERADQLTER